VRTREHANLQALSERWGRCQLWLADRADRRVARCMNLLPRGLSRRAATSHDDLSDALASIAITCARLLARCCRGAHADTFDYFVPDHYAFGRPAVSHYPGTYNCSTLFEPPNAAEVALYGARSWAEEICPSRAGSLDAPVRFDRAWSERNWAEYALPVRSAHRVPLFINQWEAVHGLSAAMGRYAYIADVAALAKQHGIGWAWWTWAGGNGEGWTHGSSELVFRFPNGSVMVDWAAVEALAPWM
jgi:hypothetical protein